MIFRESETVELKRTVTDNIKKEIIAFANCQGGKIYIGVDDDGTPAGLEDPDRTSLQISSSVRDAVRPDLTMFIHYEILESNGKQILCVDVQRGTERPYYIAGKGLRPEGVYVRQGMSAVPASETAIRRMIMETDGGRFEEIRSLEQDLTFDAAEREFQLRNVEFGPQQMQTLKIKNSCGIYTNLGLLLSDQCVHTIRAAVFQGTDQNVFRDRREFSGSLLAQLNEVYAYIDRYNETQATFDGLLRVDARDYPETAVREALLNAVVHRDYALRASTLISLYSDRIEFISAGGLMPGIEKEDILMGLSVCRNQNLANVFYRLRLIEAYGTGIRKIMRAYEGTGCTPKIETTANVFRLTLPNVHFVQSAEKSIYSPMNVKSPASWPERKSGTVRETEEGHVLEFLRRNGSVTRRDAEEMLETSASTADRILRGMVDEGLLVRKGQGRSTRYVLVKEEKK